MKDSGKNKHTDWRKIIDKYYPEGCELRDILLLHSHGVASFALELNAQLPRPLDTLEVETAAMLHDIGIFKTYAPSIKCDGDMPYICHGYLGADLLREEDTEAKYALVCERHTGAGLTPEDIDKHRIPLPAGRCYVPITPLEKLICYADKFYSKSGDMKRKPLEEVEKSIARFGEDNLLRFRKLRDDLFYDANLSDSLP